MLKALIGVAAISVLPVAGCSPHSHNPQSSSSVAASTSKTANAPAGPAPGGPAGLTGWPTPAEGPTVSADAIESALLTETQMAKVIGTEVAKTNRVARPYKAIESTDTDCDVAQGMTKESFGPDWDLFRATEMLAGENADKPDVVAYQGIASYTDAGSAHDQFSKASKAITACDGKSPTYKADSQQIPVTITVTPASNSSISWFIRYGSSPYRCFSTFQGVANVLVQSQICTGSNTRKMTQDIADRLVDRLRLNS